MLGKLLSRFTERSVEQYAAYAGHIRPEEPNIVLCMDGSVMAVLELEGVPFELEPGAERNAKARSLNTLLRWISDNNLVVYSHLVRRDDVVPAQAGQFRSRFAAEFHETYRERALDRPYPLMRNVWYFTIVARPRDPLMMQYRKRFQHWSWPALTPVDAEIIKQLDDACHMVQSTLDEYKPRRLGIREVQTDMDAEFIPPEYGFLQFSEIGEALYSMRTALWKPIPVISGSLGASIYTDRCIFWRKLFDLGIPNIPRIGAMMSFREYPSKTRPGMLNSLLGAPYPLVLGQSFWFKSRAQAESAMILKMAQMSNAGDPGETIKAGLTKARDENAGTDTTTGIHNIALAVYAPDVRTLDRHVSDASKRLAEFGGAAPVREGRMGIENAYWSLLPGTTEFRARPGKVSSRNFACLSSFENFPVGEASGYWGKPIIRFRSRGGTPWDYITHVEDVGGTMFLGRTGSGKTLLMDVIMASLEQSVGDGGLRIMIDKDASSKIMIEMCGGVYLQIQRNRPSGLAPHKLPDTPELRAMLHGLYLGLIALDDRGSITPDEENRCMRGIAAQMRMPPELRSMWGVREFMGTSPMGAGRRFEKWCKNGSMGWLLDNDEHKVNFDLDTRANLYGFDFTDILPAEEGMADDGSCRAAASVIIYQMRQKMDGRRIAACFDECRFYMDPLGGVLDDLSLTGRKKELWLGVAAQQPEHFLDHPVGKSLISQCQTKFIFPNASADEESFVNGVKVTPAAFKQIREGMTTGNKRRFMVWREGKAVICDFDLSAMKEEIAILSTRAGTARLMDRITKEVGSDTDARLDEFKRRHRQAISSQAA